MLLDRSLGERLFGWIANMSCLTLTGVIDGPLPGGTPKALELYANCNVADLSQYGLGSANNGGRLRARESGCALFALPV